MASLKAKRFYDSKAWRRARRKALLEAEFKSCVDGSDVSGRARAHVDHVIHFERAPQLGLDPLNLRVMSPAQHNQRHARADYDPARQGCDESGWPSGTSHPWNIMQKRPWYIKRK